MAIIKIKSLSFLFIALFFISLFLPIAPTRAQANIILKEEVVRAKVLEILVEETKQSESLGGGYVEIYQKVRVRILAGVDAQKEIIIDHGQEFNVSLSQKVSVGDVVVLSMVRSVNGDFQYQIIDKYRLNELISITIFFLFLVFILSRWQGVGSFLGMIFSLLVIVKFIVPQILAGRDPLLISIIGSVFILITSIYLAHGFSKQTTIAVISTAITLIFTGLLSVIFVNLTNLSGLASEDAFALQFGQTSVINFKGLLLGGMIIGFLGVLDDITTSLSATVFELKKVNSRLSFRELVTSSLNIGREHISSLVNTLVLAYAGASLPLFLFIVLNPQGYPLWFMINSEFIAEEIVRTLVGSMGLLGAVPITVWLASWVVARNKIKLSRLERI